MKNQSIHLTLHETPSGVPTLSVEREGKEIFLHSKKDPLRDRKLTEGKYGKGTLVIVLGLALGYHLLPLVEEGKVRGIIVIDPLAEEIFSLTGEMKELVHQRKILVVTGSINEVRRKLTDLVDIQEYVSISVVEHPSSVRLFPEFYNDGASVIKEIIDAQAAGAATRKRFARRFLLNGFHHLSKVNSYRPVAQLKNHFHNIPALVCSSGSGLDVILQEKIDPEKFLIIAVDSALGPLKAEGILPDILVSIDPQPWIVEHLWQAHEPIPISVTSLTGYPLELPGSLFLSLNSHPLSQVVDHLYPGKVGSVDSATGSVAGDALALALHLGCGPVYLAGQDFAFINYEIYSRETTYQSRYRFIFQKRTLPVETSNLRYIMDNSSRYMVDGFYTRKSFQGYRERFARFLEERDGEGQVVHLRKGLHLEGVTSHERLLSHGKIAGKKEMISAAEKKEKLSLDISAMTSFLSEDVMAELQREAGILQKDYFQVYRKVMGLE